MYAAVKHDVKWYFNQLQNLGNINDKIDSKYIITKTYIALVLDLPAPVDDVDGGWSLVGDLGDVDKPLDALEEGEELSIGDRIE